MNGQRVQTLYRNGCLQRLNQHQPAWIHELKHRSCLSSLFPIQIIHFHWWNHLRFCRRLSFLCVPYPFPGNLKYMHDGRICFLDFGLMDRVSPRVMEGFADGIRSVVSQNWTALAHSMQVVEFVPDPVKRSLELMETPRKYTVYHSIYVVYMIYDICIYNYSMLLQML